MTERTQTDLLETMVLVAALGAFIGGYFLAQTTCDVRQKTLTAPDGFQVEWMDYRPHQVARDKNTIFILPPTGGTTPIDRRFANRFCRDGRHVVVVTTWTGADESAIDLDLHNRLFGRANRALTMLTEHFSGRVDLLGTSLGALFGISLLAHVPKIDKAVLIVGGVPFTEIIVNSSTEHMTLLRDRRRKEFGIKDQAEYLARLNAVFKWDEFERISAEQLREKKILLIVGTRDDGVPTANQLRLVEQWPSAQVIRHESNHFMTIVKSFALDYWSIVRWLK